MSGADATIPKFDEPGPARAPASRVHAWRVAAAAIVGVVLATWGAKWLTSVGLWAPWLDRAGAWFALAGFASALALALGPRAGRGGLVLLALALAFSGWTTMRVRDVPPDRVGVVLGEPDPLAESKLVTLEGVVRTAPRPRPESRGALDDLLPTQDAWVFDLGARRLVGDGETLRVSGVVRVVVGVVRVESLEQGVEAPVGSLVRVVGMYRPPRTGRNPGEWDAHFWGAMDGRAGTLVLSAPDLVEVVSEGGAGPVALWRARVRSVIEPADAEGGGLVSALVLGEAEGEAYDRTREAFRVAGAAHLLAISGFHLTLAAFGALFLVRLAGDFGRWDALVVLAMVVLYVALVPAKAPIVRAAALVIAVLLAEARGRRADRLTVLGWVTVGLIAWRPMDVFGLGAPLSVGITVLLVWLSDRRPAWLFGPERWARVELPREPWWTGALRSARGAALTALAAWAVSSPLVMLHTGQVSLIGPLAVLVLTPLVVVVLGLGLLAAGVGAMAPGVGVLIAGSAGAVAGWTAAVGEWLGGLPFAGARVGSVSLLWCAGATLATVWVLRFARPWRPSAWWPLVVMGVWLMVEQRVVPLGDRPASGLSPGVALRIDMLAVGDGTCIVVRSGDETLLWDAGSLAPGLAERAIPRALRDLGVHRVPRIVVTHANIDHYAFVPDLIGLLGVEGVVTGVGTPQSLAGSGAGRRLLHLLEAQGVGLTETSRGDAFPLGRARGVVLWPPAEFGERLLDNDRSTVVRLEVETGAGLRSVLLTGDIQRVAKAHLLADPGALDVDILELPHHGGWHDAAGAFVEATSPVVVLQSTGPRRARSLRASGVWDDLRREVERDGAWWVTAVQGWAWAEVMEDGRIRTGALRE